MKNPVYREITSKIMAIENCKKSNNSEWLEKHSEALAKIMDMAPSGSGIDCGVKLLPESNSERLKFQCDFHHMDENGYYDGWTEHVVTVKASLFNEIDISISGRNKNNIKEHLSEIMHYWLTTEENVS